MLRADRSGLPGLLLTGLEVRLTDRPVPVSIPWDRITAVDDASPLVDVSDERSPGRITFRLRVEPEAGFGDQLRGAGAGRVPVLSHGPAESGCWWPRQLHWSGWRTRLAGRAPQDHCQPQSFCGPPDGPARTASPP